MVHKLTGFLLACLFFAGSTLLPLADFSLLPEIPGMYRNYIRITTPEESGMIDFVGDYLLHGKELFDNNQQDKAAANGSDVQFQHQANPLNIVFLQAAVSGLFVQDVFAEHPLFLPRLGISSYTKEIFRPPLA